MKTHLLAPLGAILLASFAPCQGGDVQATATITTSLTRDKFVLEPGEHEIPALVDRVAVHLDYNILYNEAELANLGTIRVSRQTTVDDAGCWTLFGSLLRHKGLAILALDPATDFYEIVMIQGPRGQEIAQAARFVPYDAVESFASQKATPILTSVPLRNINATVATNALRPFFTSGQRGSGLMLGNVGNDTDLLLQGFGPQVAAACRMLRLIDGGQERRNAQVVVVRLKYAAPEDLVARIEDTFGMKAMQAQMRGNMAMGPSDPIRAVAHPELQAVILSGSEAQIDKARGLIAELDHRGGTSKIVVVRLEHAAPQDMAARIDAVFGVPAMTPQTPGRVAQNMVAPLRAVAHPTLQAVILNGTEAGVQDALKLIAQLDIQPVAECRPSADMSQQLAKIEKMIRTLEQALRDQK